VNEESRARDRVKYRLNIFTGTDNDSKKINEQYLEKVKRWANEIPPDGYTLVRGEGYYKSFYYFIFEKMLRREKQNEESFSLLDYHLDYFLILLDIYTQYKGLPKKFFRYHEWWHHMDRGYFPTAASRQPLDTGCNAAFGSEAEDFYV